MRISKSVLVVAVLALAATTGVVGTAHAMPTTTDPYRLGADGTSAPIYSYVHAVRETTWVDIGLDQDHDGVDDRVAVDIIRPAEPAAAQQRIPVIMDTSGYYQKLGRGNEMQAKTYDSHGRPVQFPLFLDNYFVPRGYAVALTDLAGTNRSTGCADYGGPSELASSTRVIDWLNGRAPGYSSRFGDTRKYATWASGSVGMIGKSWDGQNAVETSVTGIEGLDAVVPEAAVTSDWTEFYARTGTHSYDPTTADYFYKGDDLRNARSVKNSFCTALLAKVRAAEPLNGDFTEEWAYRDWSSRAGRVRAAVLMTQGQNDQNVYPWNMGFYWAHLPASLPKKLWLSETGHVDPFDFRRAAWVDTLHRWFDRFLYKIHNGIEDGPQLSVERAPNRWVDYPSYPAAGTRAVSVFTSAGSGMSLRPGPAGATSPVASGSVAEFVSPPLAQPIRLSGTPELTVTLRTSLSKDVEADVFFDDVGPATTRGYSGRPDSSPPPDTGILEPMTTKSCWGESGPGDSACYFDTPPDVVHVERQWIGWSTRNLKHRSSVTKVQPVSAGRTYSMQMPSYPMDRVVPAGHRLALRIYLYGSSHAQTLVHVPTTRIALPVVGGSIRFAAG